MDEIQDNESVHFWKDPSEQITEQQIVPPPLIAESASDDLAKIKAIVSITLGMTLVLATGYLVAVILSDGAILLRPSEVALERHSGYNDLIHLDNSIDGSGVVVCIVDSGINLDHSDFNDMELKGWKDFISGRSTPYDDNGHGTSMAGIISANGWLKGVANDVDLLIAKALGASGSGDDSVVADAIDWCVVEGAHIISLSLGGAPDALPFLPGTGRSSGDAANEAIDVGIYVVAAAGNDGGDEDDGDVAHPSSETAVISVGGSTLRGTSWSGSSEGDNNGRFLPLPILLPRNDPHKKPEIVAPGERVPVLTNEGGWGLADGTSAATVYVTGALALLLEENPSLKANGSQGNADNINLVKTWLMESSAPEEGQTEHDDRYGYGLLQIKELLERVDSE
ncbi:MAG: S8 family serine peptidase [Euryarchaeota archaeon]|jgi:serine protease AprX|nr:S8 family serine peptidase [Euryarchaeota archaeon]